MKTTHKTRKHHNRISVQENGSKQMKTKNKTKQASKGNASNREAAKTTFLCEFPIHPPKGTLWEKISLDWSGWRTVYSETNTVADLREFIEGEIDCLQFLMESMEDCDDEARLCSPDPHGAG